MAYRVEIKLDTRTVWVIHDGIVDLTVLESSRAKSVAVLAEHGFSRLLIDSRLTEREPTPTEHHRFASTQPLYMPPHVAVAVVLRPAIFNMPRTFEQLSIKQGMLLKAFDNVEEAQAWLMRITN